MAVKIEARGKIFLFIIAGVLVIFGLRFAGSHGWIPVKGIMKSLIPTKVILPDVKDAQVQNVAPVALPQDKVATVAGNTIRADIWEWNAQNGLMLANGGPETTEGSLMAKRGVHLLLNRQDDNSKMVEDLVSCAKEIYGGATNCSTGANFIIMMGDGTAQWAAQLNPQLKKLGPDFIVKAIGSTGYSRNEDALMMYPEVKKDPNAARGTLISGVLRDGDWNIALKWAGDNSIPNNPDEKTYDPDAINWLAEPDYNTAAADYVAGKCEDRPVVKNGRPTGERKKICVTGVVTWTPGDVVAVTQKGGLVKIVSSKQYRSQMPATILGPSNFFKANAEEISQMLAAICEGGDQVKAFDQSLHAAAKIAATVYHDEGDQTSSNGDFWYRYYKGVIQTDSQGLKVELGGSSVNNLDDNLILFGLKPGSNDNFRSTYTVFKNIVEQQYPTLVKETPLPDVKEVEDKSYILRAQAILANDNDQGSQAQDVSYDQQASGATISHRAYNIQFNTGSAELTSEGEQQLQDLKDNLAITGLFIKIDGYTDNTGDEIHTNVPLSVARAQAVKQRLQKLAPNNFPNKRFYVTGHGSQNPVASNASSSGKAANRRVEITQKGQN